MGARRTTFGKLERERAKKAKAAAKRERRQERGAEGTVDLTIADETQDDGLGELSAADLLAQVELTHQRFASGAIGYEEFEEKKAELLARVPID